MGRITIRNLDEEVKRRIQKQAVANGRSMESEVRMMLKAAVFSGSKVSSGAGFGSEDAASRKNKEVGDLAGLLKQIASLPRR